VTRAVGTLRIASEEAHRLPSERSSLTRSPGSHRSGSLFPSRSA
jgi:hypothetical protein